MLISFLSKFYAIDRAELRKFLLLGLILAFTIGIYWMLSPLRDSIFCTTCCALNIPLVKWAALLVFVPLAIGYSLIVDRYARHKIFYVLCTLYALLALFFAYFLADPVYGLDQCNIEKFMINGQEFSRHTQLFSRFLGWCLYIYVESFGSLMVVLFWSFAADITTPQQASTGFSLVAMGAQLGGIFGPLIVSMYASLLGEAILVMWVAIAIMFMAGMIYVFMQVVPQSQLEGYKAKSGNHKDTKTGFMQGLKLLLSQPYLLGIFAIIAIFEIINTMFDYKLRILAQQIYSGRALTTCFSHFGMWVNIIGFMCLLLGINKIGTKLGVQKSLLILPGLVCVASVVLYFNSGIFILCLINVALRAFNYAFNQPIKEQLYIPTSKDTKYKAKAWTEMFGARGSKAIGSSVNFLLAFVSSEVFLLVSLLTSLGLIAVWVIAALYVGRKHREALELGENVC